MNKPVKAIFLPEWVKEYLSFICRNHQVIDKGVLWCVKILMILS